LNPTQKRRIFLQLFLDCLQKVYEHELKQGGRVPGPEVLAKEAVEILREHGFFDGEQEPVE
jgi:hypothetical protein